MKKRWVLQYCLERKKEWGRKVRGYSLKEEVEEEAAAGVAVSEQRQHYVQISPKEHLKSLPLKAHCWAVSCPNAGGVI